MGRKIWIVICICCCVLGVFLHKKSDHVEKFIKEYEKYQLISIIKKRSDEMRRFYVSDGYQSPDAYIAHGGGIGEFTYTNTLEAFLDSLKKGFRFIEIDMLETSDNHILGAHDWNHFGTLVNYAGDIDELRSLPLHELQNLSIKEKYNILTGSQIYDLMKSHPELTLITDKISNYKLLLKEIPFPDRMIVEVFSPEAYYSALQQGIKYPAYCIWGRKEFKIAVEYKFPIVTMAAKSFFENEDTIDMVQKLHDSGVTILLFYTTFSKRDTPEFVKKYVGKTVSKIYTDTWSPNALP